MKKITFPATKVWFDREFCGEKKELLATELTTPKSIEKLQSARRGLLWPIVKKKL